MPPKLMTKCASQGANGRHSFKLAESLKKRYGTKGEHPTEYGTLVGGGFVNYEGETLTWKKMQCFRRFEKLV